MRVEERLKLIRGIAEEIVTEEELVSLLEEKPNPIAYDGFEPSGLAHLPFGVYRPLLLRDLLKAGVRFKILLADWHAWINNKMGGDLEKIRLVGEYFIEVWKAAGVDVDKVEFIWASELVDSSEYWRKVVLIAKHTTLRRAFRCLTIMGRKEGEMNETAQLLYPMMQCADIFQLGCDMTQLGLDQRRVNMLAREIGPKIGLWKPIVVSHHMLLGLEGAKSPEGYDDDLKIDIAISSKMSKSKPQTCIYVHDPPELIAEKLRRAYCPPRQAEWNPILDYVKHIVFRAFSSMLVERESRYGGDIEYSSYSQLERDYVEGKLHPLDLKNAVARYIDQLIKPIREHFEKNRRARQLYEEISRYEVTR